MPSLGSPTTPPGIANSDVECDIGLRTVQAAAEGDRVRCHQVKVADLANRLLPDDLLDEDGSGGETDATFMAELCVR